MRSVIRLACGLAAATLLLLAGASAAFAADPLVTIDGTGGTSSDGTIVADTGTSTGTVTFGGNAPTTTADGADGSASATFGGNAPTTTADGADGRASATFGGNAPTTTADGADGSASATFGVDAANSTGDPSSPEAPSTDGALQRPSQAFGLLAATGPGGAPSGPDGSVGSDGTGDAAAGASGGGTLPETSTEAVASGPGSGYPILVLFLSLLAGWLFARRQSARSAR